MATTASHKLFVVSIICKGITALIELAGGILLFFTGTISEIILKLIRGELIEDPTDFIATYVQHFLPYLGTHTQMFGAVYLLSHGIVKLFLVISLLRKKFWAFPAAIGVLCVFITYQFYRFTHTHSVLLMILTIFDMFIAILTLHEYREMKKHIHTQPTEPKLAI